MAEKRPKVEEEKFGDSNVLLVLDRRLQNDFKKDVNAFWNLKSEFCYFPGVMPVSLSRAKLKEVASTSDEQQQKQQQRGSHKNPHNPDGEWWVTKKSHGIRYLLAFVSRDRYQQQFQLLINRKYEIRLVKFDVPLIYHDGTVLDGELVREADGRYVFYVFDVIASCGISTRFYPLSSRLWIIQHLVADIRPLVASSNLSNLSDSSDADVQQVECSPFRIATKSFAPVRQLRSFVKKEHLDYLYRDDVPVSVSTKAHHSHPCDGLILIYSHRPVTSGTDHEVVKWKPQDTADIGFVLKKAADNRSIGSSSSSSGSSGSEDDDSEEEEKEHKNKSNGYSDVFELHVLEDGGSLTVFSEQPVEATFDTSTLTSSAAAEAVYKGRPITLDRQVVECMLCVKSGLWKPLGIREDKAYPNHINVVRKTMQNAQEHITLAELERAFAAA